MHEEFRPVRRVSSRVSMRAVAADRKNLRGPPADLVALGLRTVKVLRMWTRYE